MKKLLILLFMFPSLVMAQEVITSYDKNTLSVLNEELRQSASGIQNIKGQIADLLPIDLTSSSEVTGALTIANGGTGQGTAQEAIDALTDASSGDSGQVWTTDGTNSGWQDITPSGLTLISTTTVTNTNPSSYITIDKTKNYKIIIHGSGSAHGSSWYFEVNNSSQTYLGTASEGRKLILAAYASTKLMSIDADITLLKETTLSVPNHYYSHAMFGESQSVTEGFNRVVINDINVALRTDETGPVEFRIGREANWTGTIWLYEITQ